MERLIVYKEPNNPVSEAYRIFCTNLLAGIDNKRIIELTGVAGITDISVVIANLAISMAQAGKKVLLIDCNLRSPQQKELFQLQDRGLTDCLMDVQDSNSFVQATAQANLFVLTAGTAVTNPVETLLSQPMQELLNMVKEEYDIVLLEAPSVAGVADALALGTKTDGVVLVLTNKKDKVEQAQKAKESFIQAGVTILGCVLDKA